MLYQNWDSTETVGSLKQKMHQILGQSAQVSCIGYKEKNEGFEESVYSKKTGKKINFFNLGFNNRWQKILPKSVEEKLTSVFNKEILELEYLWVMIYLKKNVYHVKEV